MAWTPPGSTDVRSNLFKFAANFLTKTFTEIVDVFRELERLLMVL